MFRYRPVQRLPPSLLIFSRLKRSTISTAREYNRLRSSSFDTSLLIVADNQPTLPADDNKPSTLARMISLGPLGQSKLITGKPQDIASQRALGKPSPREERTKNAATNLCRANKAPLPTTRGYCPVDAASM